MKFNFQIPTPKNATEANAQANRYNRALAILADGTYTFSFDGDLDVCYVIEPGKLSAKYIIHFDAANSLDNRAGCDCPDMVKTGQPCKHYFAAKMEMDREIEDAQVAAMEAYHADH
jgi:hypothetical protein